jgi:hypothetical protein
LTVRPITVVEASAFVRQAAAIWNEEERLTFIDFIARNPESGDVIPDTGGVRKVRWGRRGSGKRGGVRVVYFFYDAGAPLYLLMMYAKAQRDDVSPDAKRALQIFAVSLKRALGGRRSTP